ncbi:MAG TPA: DUF4349 domain-containing protein [Kofleriaceae bacterium]|nr:DUF4349 domain-containing protein [Kofleriaceae bacterium]
MPSRRLAPSLVLAALGALVLLAGCKSRDAEKADGPASTETVAGPAAATTARAEDAPPPPPSPPGSPGAAGAGQDRVAAQKGPEKPRKIIRTGTLLIEVDDYAKARGAIDELMRGSGGFVAGVDVGRSEGAVGSATLTLRIPEAGLDRALAALGGLGTLRRESIRAEDVSETYYDLAARLRNARHLEERMLELAAKAGKVNELLEVEREVGRVRESIEVMDGQLRGLDDRTSLATLSVEIVTRQVYVAQQPVGLATRIGNAFDASLGAMADAGEGLLLFLVAALPWMLPIGAGAWLLVRLLRRRV